MKYRVLLVRVVVEDNGNDDDAYDDVNIALENQDKVKDWTFLLREPSYVVEAEDPTDAIGNLPEGVR